MALSRRAKIAVLVLSVLFLGFSIVSSAQTPSTNPSATSASPANYIPQQDPQAVAILTRATAGLGGTALFTANTATVVEIAQTSSRGEALASVKAEDSWANGQFEFRREVSGATGAMVSNHGRPMLKGSDGSLHSLPSHAGYGMAPFYLPGAVLSSELTDGHHSLKYIEDTTIDGASVSHVRIWNGGDLFHSVQSRQDWYFDSSTGLPVRVEHRSADPDDGVKFVKITTDYKNFANINGVFTATQIVESAAHGGKITKSLSSLSLLPTLAGSEFEIGGAQ